MTLILTFLGILMVFMAAVFMFFEFSKMSKNEKLGHIIAFLFGIICIMVGIIYEMDYDTYPLVSNPVIYTQNTFVFERVEFRFENPVYILQYYYDTPWYIFFGGKNDIKYIKIKEVDKK